MVYTEIKNDDLELEVMEKRKKELLVKKKHENKISQTGNQWRTRLKDAPSGRLTAKTYDELINKLYVHYYEPVTQIKTFKEYAYEWMDIRYKSGIIEYNTYTHYRNEFKKYIEPLPISTKLINEISKSALIMMFEQIVGDGSQILKKTLGNIKTVVNGTFTYAYSQDNVNCIDASRVSIKDIKRKCKVNDTSNNVYSDDEAIILLQYLESIKPTVFTLAIELLFCLPARVSEPRALTWEDVDVDNKVIHLRHQIVDKKDKNVNRKATDVDYMKAHSPAGKRDIDLSDFALSVLERLRDINGDKKYVLNSKGKLPITTNKINEHLKKFCLACGVEYKPSHAIRFYQASKMYEKGIDEKTIQSQMGHANLGMTRAYDRRKPKKITEEQTEALYGYGILSNVNRFKKAQ